jgi:hypothetical protein
MLAISNPCARHVAVILLAGLVGASQFNTSVRRRTGSPVHEAIAAGRRHTPNTRRFSTR